MNLRTKFKIFTGVIALSFMLVLPALAAPSSTQSECDKFYKMFQTTVRNDGGTTSVNSADGLPKICTPEQLVGNVVALLLQVSGMVAVVFLMIGGFWYLTAAGNEEQTEKGRKTLTSAIIGLVVIIMAYAMVKITVNLLTNGIAGKTNNTPTTQSSGN